MSGGCPEGRINRGMSREGGIVRILLLDVAETSRARPMIERAGPRNKTKNGPGRAVT